MVKKINKNYETLKLYKINEFFYVIEAVKILLNEIIESLRQLDYENKINVRIQLKDALIKVAMLTKELDTLKSK